MLAPLCVQQTFLLLCYQTLYSEETVFISVVSSLYINGQTKVTLSSAQNIYLYILGAASLVNLTGYHLIGF